MLPESWTQVEEILPRVLAAPVADRARLLRQLCGPCPELQREVERLVAVAEDARGFMEEPVLSRAGGDGEWDSQRLPSYRVGGYRIVRQLGRGGMGTVYLGERIDQAYRGYVAIKLLRERLASADLERRFQRERQILADLRHPGIARLLDGGTDTSGRPYLVMEFIEGEAIDRHCDRLELTVDQRLDLFERVCDAVHAAHQSLVVHRDLKPANILVTPKGEPKLLDFGIAKLLRPHVDAVGVTTTSPGLAPLTLEYASPEQQARLPITPTSDIYSLGVVLYELLTGERPFQLGSQAMEAFLQQVRDQPPRPPSECAENLGGPRARRLAGDLDKIVLKALHKEPQRRYATAQDLSRDLRRYRQGRPVRARSDTLAYRLQMFLLRHKTAAVYTLATLIVLAVLATFGVSRLRNERDRAHRATAQAETMTQFYLSAEEQARETARQLQQAEEALRNYRTRAGQLEAELVAVRQEGVETLEVVVSSLQEAVAQQAQEPTTNFLDEQQLLEIEWFEDQLAEIRRKLDDLMEPANFWKLGEGRQAEAAHPESENQFQFAPKDEELSAEPQANRSGEVLVSLGGNLFSDSVVRDVVLRALPWEDLSQRLFPGADAPVRVVRGNGALVTKDARRVEHDPERSRFMLRSRKLKAQGLNVAVVVDRQTGLLFWDQELSAQVSELVLSSLRRLGFRFLGGDRVSLWQAKRSHAVIRIEGIVEPPVASAALEP